LRTRFFLSFIVIALITTIFFYAYSIQNPTLEVTLQLNLIVYGNSSSLPGYTWMNELNVNVSIIKWPFPASNRIDPKLINPFNETRTTPVRFAVSVNLDEANETIYTNNLTTPGQYSAIATLTINGISHGIHNMTLSAYVPGYKNVSMSQLTQFITIP
jgi:hypothetical protein